MCEDTADLPRVFSVAHRLRIRGHVCRVPDPGRDLPMVVRVCGERFRATRIDQEEVGQTDGIGAGGLRQFELREQNRERRSDAEPDRDRTDNDETDPAVPGACLSWRLTGRRSQLDQRGESGGGHEQIRRYQLPAVPLDPQLQAGESHGAEGQQPSPAGSLARRNEQRHGCERQPDQQQQFEGSQRVLLAIDGACCRPRIHPSPGSLRSVSIHHPGNSRRFARCHPIHALLS